MARYVVVAQNEDGLRVFGTFGDKAKAEALADRVNERIEKREDAEFEEWRASTDGRMTPDGYGRCGVLIVRKWASRQAELFALGFLDGVRA